MKFKKNIYTKNIFNNWMSHLWIVLSQYILVMIYSFFWLLIFFALKHQWPHPKNNYIISLISYIFIFGPIIMAGFTFCCIYLGTWYFRNLLWMISFATALAIPIIIFGYF